MNELASSIPPGSEGVLVLPFGNGAERVLKNKDTGGMIKNLNFNRHSTAHIIRATQEGIVFSFKYGMDIMQQTGISPKIIRAGNANMFLSPIFKNSLSTLTGATIELYDTDGSLGAARGAAIGTGYYKDLKEAFSTLKKIETIGPDKTKLQVLKDTYGNWVETLNKNL
jgi:xylulokinase